MFERIKNIFSNNNEIDNTTTSTTTTTTIISKTPLKLSPIKRNIDGNNLDYQNANYFNYYRILENTKPNNFSRINVGLSKFQLNSFIINSEMNNTSIKSTWEQNYTNNSNVPIEGRYMIPLPPYCTVSGFTVKYQDKVLIGKIKNKSKVQEKYSDTIAQGGQAFLVEKNNDNGFFNFQIGNIPPNESVTILITFISEVGNHFSSFHLCFHKFLFPIGEYKFEFNLNIKLTNSIDEIEITNLLFKERSTITIDDDKDRKEAKVLISTDYGATDNLTCIIIPSVNDDSKKPQSIIEYNSNNNSYAVSINFFPFFNDLPIDEINQKSEFIFLIDCSGSMEGNPILKAKRALDIIVRSLNENCKFNIYCFGSSFTKAFEQSRLYNDESLEEISKYITDIDANLGGTMLLPPIQDILESKVDPEYPRQLFILTDGAISNRDQLIKYVSTHSVDTRIFTYGIGNSVDLELVIGLAKANKGYYELIRTDSEMEEKVMKLLNIAFEPTLSNIKIEWGDQLLVEQSPHIIRPVYSNESLNIYALIKNKNIDGQEINFEQLVTTVTLFGNGPTGKILSFPITLDFTQILAIKNDNNNNNNSIHTLAAFNVIRDLEEIERKENHNNHKNKIEELAITYNLVSKYTSFIVTKIDEKQITNETMETIELNKQLPTTTNTILFDRENAILQIEKQSLEVKEIFRELNALISEQSSMIDSIELNVQSGTLDLVSATTYKKQWSPFAYISSFFSQPFFSNKNESIFPNSQPSPSSTEESESSNDLLNFIKKQKANGSWSSSQFPMIDYNKKPITIDNDDIWTTLFVIYIITTEYSSQQNQYDLLIQKAIKWVKQQLTKLNILDQFDSLLLLAGSSSL